MLILSLKSQTKYMTHQAFTQIIYVRFKLSKTIYINAIANVPICRFHGTTKRSLRKEEQFNVIVTESLAYDIFNLIIW